MVGVPFETGGKALLARELEGAKTLKQNTLIFRKCHGRKPVGIYAPLPLCSSSAQRYKLLEVPHLRW